MQALVRLLLNRQDLTSGYEQPGSVSGYPGSPLVLDIEPVRKLLETEGIIFQPAIYREPATANCSQHISTFAVTPLKLRGVFGLYAGPPRPSTYAVQLR